MEDKTPCFPYYASIVRNIKIPHEIHQKTYNFLSNTNDRMGLRFEV